MRVSSGSSAANRRGMAEARRLARQAAGLRTSDSPASAAGSSNNSGPSSNQNASHSQTPWQTPATAGQSAQDYINSGDYESVMTKYVKRMKARNRNANMNNVSWGSEVYKSEHKTDDIKLQLENSISADQPPQPAVNVPNPQVNYLHYPVLMPEFMGQYGHWHSPAVTDDKSVPPAPASGKSVNTIRINDQSPIPIRKQKTLGTEETLSELKMSISWAKYKDLSPAFKSNVNLNPPGASSAQTTFICCVCSEKLKTTSHVVTGEGLILCVSCQEWYLNIRFDNPADEIPLYRGRVFFNKDLMNFCFCENVSPDPCGCDQIVGGCLYCIDPPVIRRDNKSILNHPLLPSWFIKRQFYCKDANGLMMLENCKFVCQSMIAEAEFEQESDTESELLFLSDDAVNISDAEIELANDDWLETKKNDGAEDSAIETDGLPTLPLLSFVNRDNTINGSPSMDSGQMDNNSPWVIDD